MHDKKTRKPLGTPFKQQTLPCWEPIITARTVLPFYFTVGILFIPAGVALMKISRDTSQLFFDYTYCKNDEGVMCSTLKNSTESPCQCKLRFPLVREFEGDVFLYYWLHDFFQNHRRYLKSRDVMQLRGILSDEPSSDCFPFDYGENKKPIVPCGAIANSLFTDRMVLYYGEDEVPLLKKGIAWPFDKAVKFRNPPGDLKEVLQNFDKPRNWTKNLWELDPNDTENNGLINEDFIIWMRPAALPDFKKLYRIVDRQNEPFKNGLPVGNYTVIIDYTFHVVEADSRKAFVMATTSPIGAKNPFLGFIYIVVGTVCLLMGFVFLAIYFLVEKRQRVYFKSSELVKSTTTFTD